MVRKVLYIPILLVLSIFVSSCSPPVQEVISQSTDNFDSAILENLDVEKIYSNVKELSQEPRVAGTASEKNAANFITSQLETYGYSVESQDFQFLIIIFFQSLLNLRLKVLINLSPLPHFNIRFLEMLRVN